jgi:hypothetical protein
MEGTSNKEQGMMNVEVNPSTLDIRYFLFDVQGIWQKEVKTSTFDIRCSLFDIHHVQRDQNSKR